jgi:hypothetical protein
MINTNGFITEYIKAVQNKEWLEKEEKRANEALAIPREKIRQIEFEYGVKDLELKLKDVIISKRDNVNVIRYYYFRSIIDGVYNLLKEYGWKYCAETFGFLSQTFGVHYSLSEGFDVFYVDYITCLNPTCVLDLVGDYTQHYIRFMPQTYDDDFISIPVDLDIMFVLNETEKFLQDSVKLYEQKESDEEYKTYLRLKEKYEGKDK